MEGGFAAADLVCRNHRVSLEGDRRESVGLSDDRECGEEGPASSEADMQCQNLRGAIISVKATCSL